MATLVLSAAGAALGSSLGGSVLGLSMTAVGRFAGASLGRAIDQRLLGQGAEPVETGRLDRLRMTGAGEGQPIAQVYGRARVGGHVIWASQFTEHVSESGGGGKGGPPQPKIRRYAYSVNMAVALCEGEVLGVNRIWADGVELSLTDVTMQVYKGNADQLPDPKIEAIEGAGRVPAYRGTAYVVFEDLMLERFGNRVPQFSFEVTRAVQDDPLGVPHGIRAVALMPGSGDYALSADRVHFDYGEGVSAQANVNTPHLEADLLTSLRLLGDEVPNCEAVSLIVSWFGDDLRCGQCQIKPKVEQKLADGSQGWQVAGLTRATADEVPYVEGGPVYGGTPSDASVIQSIAALQEAGKAVMFYPFILMDQLADNALVDPWTGSAPQPPLPWRGRITTSLAPGVAGSPSQTAQAAAEVAAFFGSASASDFTVSDGAVVYSGPAEWSLRRFILHSAALCAAAGGVAAFCIGSELRGLTQIRDAAGFPAVQALRDLASEVRSLLGPDTKLGYAADWSEYFGYQPPDGSGDVLFHLDPLWADDAIDFIGIDNYMPLSDWRDGFDHRDAGWGSVYNPDYLSSQIEGGEGFDWYYPTSEARAAQRREPITDGAYGEPWVYRYKDIRSWWSTAHHDRIGGLRQDTPSDWIPQSKPIWFTELGCPAVDKGTNQPNKFLDPKSSESSLPYFSNGLRDELIQHQYLAASLSYWDQPGRNPLSDVYGGPMLDTTRSFVWAWDARPYPWFPNADGVWSDGPNWRRGHWITGRTSAMTLAAVVREICAASGLTAIDTRDLHGFVRGYVQPGGGDARRALQPLMLAYGFDAIERDGLLVFRMRGDRPAVELGAGDLALHDDLEHEVVRLRAGEAELTGRVRLAFTQADGDFHTLSEETMLPDDRVQAVSDNEVPLSLTRAEARQTVERWLSEARVARDSLRFALPLSRSDLGAGDTVRLDLPGLPSMARIDRVDLGTHALIDAVRAEGEVYHPSEFPDDPATLATPPHIGPVLPFFMDLPILGEGETAHAPFVAVTARPWPGSAAVYSSDSGADYRLDMILAAQATAGVTLDPLARGCSGRVTAPLGLRVKLTAGQLQSVDAQAFLAGGNLFAIGDGHPDRWEVFQARDAVLEEEGVWRLSHLLRGQLGTDALTPDVWPVGSYVVALDGAEQRLPLVAALRGLERSYRVGPARLGYDDPLYAEHNHAFFGNALRPYAPVHLRQSVTPGGDISVTWVRRSRIDGNLWDLPDIPLGELREAYRVELRAGGQVLRSHEVTERAWTYDAATRAADVGLGVITLAVAQLSDRFGPGAYAVQPVVG